MSTNGIHIEIHGISWDNDRYNNECDLPESEVYFVDIEEFDNPNDKDEIERWVLQELYRNYNCDIIRYNEITFCNYII